MKADVFQMVDQIRELSPVDLARVLAAAIDTLGEAGDEGRDAATAALRDELEGDSAPYTEHGLDLLGQVIRTLS